MVKGTITLLFVGSATLVSSCASHLRTQEIAIDRDPALKPGQIVLVDVIWPETSAERQDILDHYELNPNGWFQKEQTRSRKVFVLRKELQPRSQAEVIRLDRKTAKTPGILIIAECGDRPDGGRDQPPRAGRGTLVALDNGTNPPPRRRELIRVGPGYLERLNVEP